MKKIIFFFIILSLSFLFYTRSVYAHFLQSDGNIGAVLHIDPGDDPIAGEQAGFFFEFKDRLGKFNPENCDCTVYILENGKEVFSKALFSDRDNALVRNASFFYTFPEKGVYQIKVMGAPVNVGGPDVGPGRGNRFGVAFEKFTLIWNIRVDRETNRQSTAQQNRSNFFGQNLIYDIILGLFVIFLFIYFIKNKIHQDKADEGGDKKDEKDNSNIY